MHRYGILIVEDDPAFAGMCAKLLAANGYRVGTAVSGREAIEALDGEVPYQAVLTDIRMPEMDGMALLQTLRERHPRIQVVLMTGYGTIRSAVEAMKAGAAEYIPKPFDNEELLITFARLARLSDLAEEVRRLRGELNRRYGFDAIVGRSPEIRAVCERVRAACETLSTVLITGESGTGKELVARTIHYNSAVGSGPFVPVNCAALPADIIESELFGHRKGAFTGAVAEHEGLFRAADGGTILLDEFTEMGPATQAKLLRVIEDGRVRSLGATEEVEVRVRVLAATNREIEGALREGRLREDLYYRLSVISIRVPPLREHLEDIPLLAAHILEELNRRSGRRVERVEDEALAELACRPWPGNVRELRNVIEGAFVLSRGPVITPRDLAAAGGPGPRVGVHRLGWGEGPLPALPRTLGNLEHDLIIEALRRCDGNKSRAAAMLGISRKRIYRRLEEHGIGE